jgi:exopolyphosphatase/guanosine-5'-triphosphate,3'-diphosphate pyrophosphatase
MLWMSEDMTKGASLVWQPRKRHLLLKLSKDAEALFGEVAEARFKSLATALEATYDVKIT